MTAAAPATRPDRRTVIVIACVLAFVTLVVYWRAASYGFLVFDDSKYFEPPEVRAGLTLRGVAWALTHVHFANWHPLTTLTYMAAVSAFGVDRAAGPLHVLCIALHVTNGLLLFALLRRLTGATWRSAVVAALFLLHPLHVESVAWVSELKDVLCALFFLLAIHAYHAYVVRPGKGRYAAVLVLFALGLMSKAMVVTLPFVLLLLDYWPLGRLTPGASRVPLRRAVIEKAPLLALALASSLITLVAQRRGGAMSSSVLIPMWFRFENATVAYVLYLWKTLWPRALAAIYPLIEHHGWQIASAAAMLLAVTLTCVWQARHRPYLIVGWLWFIGMLVPVIGLVQVGPQALADRYTYLPLIGVFVMVAWLAAELARHRPRVVHAVTAALLVACATRTWFQVGYWRNDLTLFSRAVAVTRYNWFAGVNRADALYKSGRVDEAIGQYRDVLRDTPDNVEAVYGLGVCFGAERRYAEAIEQFRRTLQLKPNHADAHNSLAFVMHQTGDIAGAESHAAEAVRIDPDAADYRYNLALALIKQGKIDDALAHLRKSLDLRPTAEAHATLADLLVRRGDLAGARAEVDASLKLASDYAAAHGTLGLLLVRERKLPEAESAFRRAAELDPGDAEARYQLATVLVAQGRLDDADAMFAQVRGRAPSDPRLPLQSGVIAQLRGDLPAAVKHYRAAIAADLNSNARNNLAWILATARDASLRDGAEALRLVESMRAQGRPDSPELLDTLAAACAETGAFTRAADTARRAVSLANQAGNPKLAEQINARVTLYEQGKPYRE
jgi:tetratricopeptide (TPR) repeat protein